MKSTPNSLKFLNRSFFKKDNDQQSISSLHNFKENNIEYSFASSNSSIETIFHENVDNDDNNGGDCDAKVASIADETCDEKPSPWLAIIRQIIRRGRKQPFTFNLMILGTPGLGKSTFVNSFFLRNISSTGEGVITTFDEHYSVRRRQIYLHENEIDMSLNVIDMPKFGSLIDNTGSWDKAANYIKEQHFFFELSKIDPNISYRVRNLLDFRVHLCFYFIAPTGHFLSDLDIATLKALQDFVSIVPIIGRADSLNKTAMREFKIKVSYVIYVAKLFVIISLDQETA